VSDFMRVARSFAWQQSMAMRGYARMGVIVGHPQGSRDVLDDALEVVTSVHGMRSWSSMWLRSDANDPLPADAVA